jgi:2-polyprenyl-3-methyl-5-hydroxy-6-metoxy-1,4-benzoquinol methylase
MVQETNRVNQSTCWEQIDCPVCGSSDFKKLFEKQGEPYVRCNECGLVMINPRPVYAEHVVNTYDEDYSAGYMSKAKKKVRRFTKWVKRVQRFGKKSGRWLDVGCSAGFVLESAMKQGFDVYGIDVEAYGVEMARKRLSIATVYQGFLEDCELPENYFDVISVYEVIEHIPTVNEFVASLKRLLAPGGVIDISTPDVGHWRVPKDLKSWKPILPSEHLYNFDRYTLKKLLEKHGLKVVKQRFNLKPGLKFYATHA